MRSVRYSSTARDQLRELLLQGAKRFGVRLALEKREVAYRAIEELLARNPGVKRANRRLKLVVYPITETPFVVLYDFDDKELRIHFVLHYRATLRGLDPKSVEW